MSGLMKHGFCRRVRSARVHAWLGLFMFTVACHFMITGAYANLAARQQAESLLNLAGLVSMFYAATAWCLHFFLNPRPPPARACK